MAFQSCTSTPNLFDSFLASQPINEVLRRLKTLIDWGRKQDKMIYGYKLHMAQDRARYRGLDRVHEQLTWGIATFNLRRVCALARA